jgi:ElaA protein
MIEWQWSAYAALSKPDLYAIIQQRQQVFILEQRCLYADLDGLDLAAWHLLGWQGFGQGRELVAYLRCLPPGVRYPEPSLGRILTSQSVRGTGIGREIVARGIEHAARLYPSHPIRIAAQFHLQAFYAGFGFVPISEAYDEDGIRHLDMQLIASSPAEGNGDGA